MKRLAALAALLVLAGCDILEPEPVTPPCVELIFTLNVEARDSIVSVSPPDSVFVMPDGVRVVRYRPRSFCGGGSSGGAAIVVSTSMRLDRLGARIRDRRNTLGGASDG